MEYLPQDKLLQFDAEAVSFLWSKLMQVLEFSMSINNQTLKNIFPTAFYIFD